MRKKNALIKSTVKCSKYNVILSLIDEFHNLINECLYHVFCD